MTNGTIITAQPESVDCAVNELRAAGISSSFEPLAPGVILADAPFGEVAAAWRGRPPVFARHICPADVRLPPDAAPNIVADACAEYSGAAGSSASFSVQSVFYTAARAMEYTAAVAGSDAFAGIKITPERPEACLSIVGTPKGVFAGFSRTEDNLSPWAGGMFRFADTPERVSRAEFKLLEASELFGLRDSFAPERGERAIDLGAAPGGWTRVLRGFGFAVTAVDPASLDPRVASDPGVTHYKGLSQTFIESNPAERFSVLVNDMRMDALESAKITCSALPALASGGLVVMTLKLPQKGMQRAASRALAVLEDSLTIIGARQLFHNRSEATVAAVYAG